MPENDREIVALWTSICSQTASVAELLGTPIGRRKTIPNDLYLVNKPLPTTPPGQRRSTYRKHRDVPA